MVGLFSDPPNYCPSCGGQILSKIKDDQTGLLTVFGCEKCDFRYQIDNPGVLGIVIPYIETFKDLDDELVVASTPGNQPHGLQTRVLQLRDHDELVLVLPSNLSVLKYREQLKYLKNMAIRLSKFLVEQPGYPKRFFYEYDRLVQEDLWHYREIAEQVSFDFLISLLMHLDKTLDIEKKEQALLFCKQLLVFIRKRPNKIESIITDAIEEIKQGSIPWLPDMIQLGPLKIRDSFRSWKREIKGTSIDINKTFLLADFWKQSIKNGYWKKAEELLSEYNDRYKVGDSLHLIRCQREIARTIPHQY